MGYLYGIWGCFIAFAAAGLSRLLVVRRIRRELDSLPGSFSGAGTNDNSNSINLLKRHKASFPVSRTRLLSNTLLGLQLLATGAGLVLIIAAQFQPHSIYHLIPAGR
jgi:hypothetical protein